MRFIIALWLGLLNISAFSNTLLPDEKLVFSIDIIRHGDRTPTEKIPKFPYPWKEGLGQLTAIGIQQEYQLGARLRKKYVDYYHLLPHNYTSGTIYVRSSDADRALMSAQAFLMGLYPPGTGPYLPQSKQPALPNAYQPIPIHTVPKEQDNLLKAWTESIDFKKLLALHVYVTPAWQQKETQLKAKFPAWSQAAGIRITDLFQLKSLGNILFIYQQHHISLPEFKEEDAQQIINAGNWAYINAFKSPQIGKKTAADLLATITDQLQKAAEKPTQLKYILFSAHDSTQLGLMSALEAPLNVAPDYAADLNFSLLDQGDHHYQVKISFNDQAVNIPACKGSLCTLSQLKEISVTP